MARSGNSIHLEKKSLPSGCMACNPSACHVLGTCEIFCSTNGWMSMVEFLNFGDWIGRPFAKVKEHISDDHHLLATDAIEYFF